VRRHAVVRCETPDALRAWRLRRRAAHARRLRPAGTSHGVRRPLLLHVTQYHPGAYRNGS